MYYKLKSTFFKITCVIFENFRFTITFIFLFQISFLDYMCYIPLFLSMHDNICYNPLDMSNQKYVQPPRERPPSVQRDMNPLGKQTTNILVSDFLKPLAMCLLLYMLIWYTIYIYEYYNRKPIPLGTSYWNVVGYKT